MHTTRVAFAALPVMYETEYNRLTTANFTVECAFAGAIRVNLLSTCVYCTWYNEIVKLNITAETYSLVQEVIRSA